MQRYIADVETNGLLDQLTTIHCLWLKDPETGEKFDYADQPGHTPIREGLARLTEADVIIGHKLIAFDIKAIQKVYPDWTYKGSLLDTLILSQMLWPEIKKIDHKRRATGHTFPGKLIGRHGLEAWGWRLGLHKGDYAKECKTNGIDPWAEWNPSMHDYCGGDVDVTDTVLKRAEKRLAEYDQIVERENAAALSIEIECRFAHIISEMEHGGFPFNEGKAAVLYAELCDRRQALHEELTDIFPPKEVCTPFTPKANNSKLGYRKGVPTVKRKIVEFNPNSRQMIADRLIEKYGWKPDAYGKDGVPQLDDEVLSTLPYPEAKPLSEYMLVTKRIGQLAEGRVALLKAAGTDGRIHGRVDTVGTVTRRCTHKHPNVAQVPSVDAEYGEQFRELFEAPEGYVLVGADASGLELRCLAHYMAEFDGGKYAAEVVDGDVHTKNQTAAGLPTRGNAKTFIYAFLYGAGGWKIGSIVGVEDDEIEALLTKKGMVKTAMRELDYLEKPRTKRNVAISVKGQIIKARFLRQTPALAELIKSIKETHKNLGILEAIDGGKMTVRSAHSALNTLLQSCGSILVKYATVILYDNLSTSGWVWGKDWALVAHIHDELQMYCKKERADELGILAVEAIAEAGRRLNLRCPLDGEYKTGANWAETH